MEHLWLEIQGKNKHSKLLLGNFYRSEAMHRPSVWLDKFEDLISYITTQWDGLLVLTGDMNFDLLGIADAPTRRYMSLLDTLNVKQVIDKPTRTTRTSRTLLDHIIINDLSKITSHGVIPCSIVSDHDGPFACVNIRVARYQPRYKYIRNLKNLSETAFLDDDPDDQLETLNTLKGTHPSEGAV